jgi:hypothetical protein
MVTDELQVVNAHVRDSSVLRRTPSGRMLACSARTPLIA